MTTTSEDINKQEPITEAEIDAEKPETYIVKFINESDQIYPIYFFDRPTEKLYPGQEFVTEVSDPNNLYARWKTVIWKGNYQFEFEVRPGWKEPEKEFPVTIFTNYAGANVEILNFPIGSVKMPKGISVHQTCWLHSHIAEYKKYSIRKIEKTIPASSHLEEVEEFVEEPVKRQTHEGYIDHQTVKRKVRLKEVVEDPAKVVETVEIVLEDRRSPEELKKLFAMRDEHRKRDDQAHLLNID